MKLRAAEEGESGNNRRGAKGRRRVWGKSEKKKVEEVRTDGDSGQDRKNCLRKCHVWPCWNAVKTDGASRREKRSPSWQPSGRWVTLVRVRQCLHTLARLNTRIYVNVHIHLVAHGGFASRFRQLRFYSRARRAREPKQKILETHPTKLFFYENASDRNFITHWNREMGKLEEVTVEILILISWFKGDRTRNR